jgi:hypothetical protein
VELGGGSAVAQVADPDHLLDQVLRLLEGKALRSPLRFNFVAENETLQCKKATCGLDYEQISDRKKGRELKKDIQSDRNTEKADRKTEKNPKKYRCETKEKMETMRESVTDFFLPSEELLSTGRWRGRTRRRFRWQ